MKITRKAKKINLNRVLDVSVDVHKGLLYFYFVCEENEYSDTCHNKTYAVEKRLLNFLAIVKGYGYATLRVICEPTGQYHNILLRTARRLGCLTCFVNAESVKKFRVVETNDSGKTDTKDPRVIHTLGKLDKVITHRLLNEKYLSLRKLNKIYDDNDIAIVSLRNRINAVRIELFCDYSFEKDFLYGNTGQALVDNYGCNPYRIIAAGYKRFGTKMKKSVPRIRQLTLERLWHDAQSSTLNELPASYVDILEIHLKQMLTDWRQCEDRKKTYSAQMVEILAEIRKEDPLIPKPTPEIISEKNLARLIGETGPISDFSCWRKLMRYAGLNIRERNSGTYKGLNKITKKGRRLLRKILFQTILPLVRKTSIYGPFYHGKKENDKMPGTKAMTVVVRHFLRKFYGWYKSGKAFEQHRYFTCESQYLAIAA